MFISRHQSHWFVFVLFSSVNFDFPVCLQALWLMCISSEESSFTWIRWVFSCPVFEWWVECICVLIIVLLADRPRQRSASYFISKRKLMGFIGVLAPRGYRYASPAKSCIICKRNKQTKTKMTTRDVRCFFSLRLCVNAFCRGTEHCRFHSETNDGSTQLWRQDSAHFCNIFWSVS